MDGILKVTPNDLINAAGEFSSQGSTISSLTNEMTNLVTGLSSIWEGEAATAYITKFRGLDDDIQLINRMIQEHVTDLTEMAQTYQQAEETSIEEFETLSTDVII